MKLPSKLPINTITNNLPNLTGTQISQLTNTFGNSQSNWSQAVVGINTNLVVNQTTNKTFSVRLMKWVESHNINGINYSLFYTEVDHNFKVGDRIFITGGYYDSALLVENNPYQANTDGYQVLFVDRCKLVLNIKYIGIVPTNEEQIDNFSKIYVASTQDEFNYFCQTLSMRLDGGVVSNRFDLGLNDFLYLNGTFSISPGDYKLTGFATDPSVSSTSLSYGNSFMYRGASSSNNYFIDVTNNILTDNYTQFLNPLWASQLTGYYNNGKLVMMNGNFTSGGTQFRNGYYYYYNATASQWQIDKSYVDVIVSKSNFRGGLFKDGTFNQGLYGQHDQTINYYGDGIEWNLGTVLNTNWYTGKLNSTVYESASYFTIFDLNNLPQIRANAPNNGGSGYNYVFDVNFIGGYVVNGNIFNMATVQGTNSSVSVLENYLTGVPINYSINISGGVYYHSDIYFANITNAELINSYAFNSMIQNSTSVNSEIEASVFLNSNFMANNIVKIQNYEESDIGWYDSTSTVNYKMYKFYVDETDWSKLVEFQRFYLSDISIASPSTELLNFFDDKFTIGNYLQTYDIPGSKPTREVLIQLSTKEDNRNSPGSILGWTTSLTSNPTSLPSLDIFIAGGQDFDFATGSNPRTAIGNNIDITSSYILDSDFVSGLFINSNWISGNYINYNADYSFDSNGTYASASLGNINSDEISLYVPTSYRPDLIGPTSSLSEVVFINGLQYDTTLNGGNNLVMMPDTYIVSGSTVIGSQRRIDLQDIATTSIISTYPPFTDQKYFKTINAENKYNYIHPVKFQNSIISSGIFQRAYFEGCTFYNYQFDNTDKDLLNLTNNRSLLLSDILFTNNNNTINSGLVQHSSFISGNDNWNNGIFHQGIWNSSTFTYSSGATTSNVITVNSNGFQNGIVRNSRWNNGSFQNGLFYENDSNTIGTLTALIGTMSAYYRIGDTTKWSWLDGTFVNGDFEKSVFETGTFSNGNFYNSDFVSGIAYGGNFGRTKIPFQNSRVWSGTFSNVTVINAEFRAQDPISSGNYAKIDWYSGVFNSGLFGVDPTSYYVSNAIWNDGVFNGGDFTDVAVWYTGTFSGGNFTSIFGSNVGSGIQTPYYLNNMSGASYSWQSGQFNGGNFGNSLSGDNSLWYTGQFNGGNFQGKYWKDGVFTRGTFNGSGATATDYTNYNTFIRSFNTQFYGYWNNGFVTPNKDKFIVDEKLFTDIQRTSTKITPDPTTEFNNMLWAHGTFSHSDGVINNSVWLDGAFQNGTFNDSAFNPYINLIDPILFPGSITGIVTQTDCLQKGLVYTLLIDVINNSPITGCAIYPDHIGGPNFVPFGIEGIFSLTFSATSNDFNLYPFFGAGASYSTLILYPGVVSGFNTSATCVWENGKSISSDFYYSKWKNGNFSSHATSSQGNAWGIVWEDGICNYMNANNIIWKSGTWRNGNWNGAPFTQIATYSSGQFTGSIVYPGFASDIINNLSGPSYNSYTHKNVFMNDAFTGSGNTFSYDPLYNNATYSLGAYSPHIGGSIPVPSNVVYGATAVGTTYSVATRFGNAFFNSGVWENGVWIDGYRNDQTTVLFSDLAKFAGGKNLAYRSDVWTWTFQLDCVNATQSTILNNNYKSGDKVSVGNIITIDINGNRRLLRGYQTVVSVLPTAIILSFNVNFPIVSISLDSDQHLIYLTKNVWLNGIFLNGKFQNGVWSNGIFQGLPYTSEMLDTQWIDGEFNGGRFRGLTSSYTDFNNTLDYYHTGLIQNFVFYDNNVSGKPYQFQYNSWIDVNFFQTSGVNINKINNVYKLTGLGFTSSYVENNFYGYPTMDVLSSVSTIRNGFDLNTRSYKLGWKYREYTDSLLNQGGEFVDINQYNFTNTAIPSSISGFGIDNFISDGWTFSYQSSDADGFGVNNYSIASNIGSLDSLALFISGGIDHAPTIPLDNNSNFSVELFDNTNVQIEKLRYSFIELTAEDLSTHGNSPIVFYNNYPSTYSIASTSLLFNNNLITIPLNQIYTYSVSAQREYFFNKPNLQMTIFGGPTYSLEINQMRYVETDMIPFFQFADDCVQFRTITTWDTTPVVSHPGTTATGPLDPPHPHQGQWELAQPLPSGNLTDIPGWGDPTWDNFYLVNGGNGCISYVNKNIQIPYFAIAPDIQYGNANFSYLSSVAITIPSSHVQTQTQNQSGIFNQINNNNFHLGG